MLELQTPDPSPADLRRAGALILDPSSSNASRLAALDSTLLPALLCDPLLRRRSLAILTAAAAAHPSLLRRAAPHLRSLLLIPGRIPSEVLAVLAAGAGEGISVVRSVLDDDLALLLASSHSIAVRSRLLDLLLVDVRGCVEAGVLKAGSALEVFLGLSKDLYPLVRRRALDGLAALCNGGNVEVGGTMTVMMAVYDRAVGSLRDEDVEVRAAAVRLVSEWGRMVTANHMEGVDVDGIADAVFVQLCSMTRDMDMKVRVEAFLALEKVKVVSESLLLQSQSKKLLGTSNGGSQIGAHALHLIREYKFSLAGAAGAFIHGLEDEFHEVREATCISMGMLSILSIKFADRALNLLMDMLNDDNMDVKLRVLRTFLDMARYGRLKVQEVHTHMFLGMFVDISSSIRRAAREVVCVVKLLDMNMFRTSVQMLLSSLEKYPEDEEDIFFALFHVGRNHVKFAAKFTEESYREIETSFEGEMNLCKARVAALLVIAISIHFSCEKFTCDIPQRVYSYAISFLGRISLPLRRVVSCEHILAFLCYKSGMPFSLMLAELKEKEGLGNTVYKHMSESSFPMDSTNLSCLLQDKISETVIGYEMVAYGQSPYFVGGSQQIEIHDHETKTSIALILKTIAETWPMILSSRLPAVLCTLRTCKEEVEMISEGSNGPLSAYVAFTLQYIQAIHLIAESWTYFSQRKSCVSGLRKLDILLAKLDRVLRKLRCTFPGYSKDEEVHILELTLLCYVAMLHGVGICSLPLLKNIHSMLCYMENLHQGDLSEISDFVKELKITSFESGSSKTPALFPVNRLLKVFSLKDIQFSGKFRHIEAVLAIPGNDSENLLPFVSGLPVGIPFLITLYNVSKSNRLWLQMTAGESIQHKLLDLHQFEGTDSMRSCTTDMPFYGAPRAAMFILKAAVVMECPSQSVTRLRKGDGGPRYETTTLSEYKDIYLVNIGNR